MQMPQGNARSLSHCVAFAGSSVSIRGCVFYCCCNPGGVTTVASLSPPYVAAGAPLVRSCLAISVRYSLLVRWAVEPGWLGLLAAPCDPPGTPSSLFPSLSLSLSPLFPLSLSPSPCSPETPPSSLSCLLTSLFHIYMPRIPTVVCEAVPPGTATESQTDKQTERRTDPVCFLPSLVTGVRPCSLHLQRHWGASHLGWEE
jgi:hypothetical protein